MQTLLQEVLQPWGNLCTAELPLSEGGALCLIRQHSQSRTHLQVIKLASLVPQLSTQHDADWFVL